MKNFEEKKAWAYPGTAQIFGVPPIISGTGIATDFNFGQRVHPNKIPLKILEHGERGVSRDCPIFWVPPIISGTGKATDFKFIQYIQRVYPNKSPEKGTWAYPGTAQFFRVPHIISGKGKATDFKFDQCIHFRGSIRTKVH